jgi:ABC-2 type transport system ATP-binding protein
LTFVIEPPADIPARELQAKLLDAKDIVIDAVPKGGAVRFIRQPDASEADLARLVPGARAKPREEDLEDAFMMLLRAHHDTTADGAPEIRHAAIETEARKAPDDDKPVIVVRDLVRKFGDFTAVARTSFDVKRGEIFGLLGPNGAGKTTTFRMLCGLLAPTSGHLEVAGLDLRTARAQARGRVGYVSQKFALYGDLTVRENLEFFGGAYGLRGAALRTRVEESLRQFGLDPAARSGAMPGGFKQRLAMAAALQHHPDILFLDEPTSGIDPLARRMFWRTITALAQGGVTIIVTTHFMEEAEYCDRIAIQDAGRVLALGTPKEVREQAGADHSEDMNSAFIGIVERARTQNATEKAA